MSSPAAMGPIIKCITLIKMNMNERRYESPEIEILTVEVDQAILASSFTGESINGWEDM